MKWRLLALLIGFCIDLAVGDPPGLPHPVVAMGRQISFWEKRLRRLFPVYALHLPAPAGRPAGSIRAQRSRMPVHMPELRHAR